MTEESQKGTYMSNMITTGSYCFRQSTFVQSSYRSADQSLGEADFLSALSESGEQKSDDATCTKRQNVSVQREFTRIISASELKTSFIDMRPVIPQESVDECKPEEVSDNADKPREHVTPLRGIGSIPVGNNTSHMVMASEVTREGCGDPIVRVHMGGRDIDVNISEVDPKNATIIEMFAYCQYADAHGTGTGSTFGSFNALKGVTDPLGGKEYSSMEEAINKKSNWESTISSSSTTLTKKMTGEVLDASVLIKMLKDTALLLATKGKNKGLSDLTDEQWNKLLGDTDRAIEA